MPAERLQKIIAAAGIASRRAAEKMITSGLVEVNGKTVTELGTKADLEHDHIRVNGKLLHGAEQHIYLLMNKPKGYVTTVSDPEHRPTVMDLLRGIRVRVYPVGRLDYATEGLLILTNDGELAHSLMKAASHVPKTYVVKVAGVPSKDGLRPARAGGLSLHRQRPAGENCSGESSRGPRVGEPLVRSHTHRRQEPPDPQDVRGNRPSRGEDQARPLRPAGAGLASGRVPPR